MRRVVTNLLLLMSIAAAAPDGRPKRHLAYIKNFILTTFFGDNLTPTTQKPVLEPEFEYELYRIPGYNDILIKILKCKSDEITIVNNPGEEMEIKPFESYIGTNNVRETEVAFQNVYTLLSTGILNQPETEMMQVMDPIINGLNRRVHPNTIRSVTIHEGEIKQIPTQMNINGYNNNDNLYSRFETIYLAPPLKKKFTLKRYQERTDERNIMRTPHLPTLFNQKLHKVFPLETNSYPTSKGGNVYKAKQFIRLESEHFRNNLGQELIPLDSVALGSTHLKKPVYIGIPTKDKHDKITLDDNIISKSIGTTPTPHDFLFNDDSTVDYNYSKTSIPRVKSTDKINNNIYNAPEDKITPINHKHPDKLDIVKEKAEISTQLPFDINNVNVPSLIITTKANNENITVNKYNIVKTSDDLPTRETLSPYENKKNSSNVVKFSEDLHKNETRSQYENKKNSSNVVKTSDNLPKSETISQFEIKNNGSNVVKTSNNFPKSETLSQYENKNNSSNVVKSSDNLPKTETLPHYENKNDDSNVVKTSDNLPISETLSQYIYDDVDHNKSHSDSILKEKDKLHTELSTDKPLRKNTSVLSIVEKTSINVHNLKLSDTQIQIKEDPIETTNSKANDSSKHANLNVFGEEKLRDNSNTSINNNSLLYSQLDNSSNINDGQVNIEQSEDIDINIVHTNDSNSDKNIVITVKLVEANDNVEDLLNGSNFSQSPNEQISYNNFSKPYRNFEAENQVKTNVHTNSPLPQEDSSKSPIVDTDPQEALVKTSSNKPKQIDSNENIFNLGLDGNEVKTNAISNTPRSNYNDYAQPITNSPPVNYTFLQIGDNKETSFTENVNNTSRIKLPHGSETVRISLKDSLVIETDDAESEERDKESQNFSGSFTKGRGDIPY